MEPEIKCPDCDGWGVVEMGFGEGRCPTCNGTGILPRGLADWREKVKKAREKLLSDPGTKSL